LATGKLQPLVNAKVELCIDWGLGLSDVVATKYTTDSGSFYFAFSNPEVLYGKNIFVMIYAETTTFRMGGIGTLLYTYRARSPQQYNNVNSNNEPYLFDSYVKLDKTSDASVAFTAMQGMVVAEKFALEYTGIANVLDKTGNKLQVVFPFDDFGIKSFCYGNVDKVDFIYEITDAFTNLSGPFAVLLNVLLNAGGINGVSCINRSDYDSWETMTHEYGHYVEAMTGNYNLHLLEFLLNSPTHSNTADHFDEGRDKGYATRLTWSEGWATALSVIARSKYKQQYGNVPGFEYGINNPVDFMPTVLSGEAQEDTITAMLWRLYANTGENSLNFGAQEWVNATMGQIFTLTDFVKNFERRYASSQLQLARVLSEVQIAPRALRTANQPNINTPLLLFFETGGSVKNPNNYFDIIFFDMSGKEIWRAKNLQPSGPWSDGAKARMTCLVPYSDWAKVISLLGTYAPYKVGLAGGNAEGSPITGAYMSGEVLEMEPMYGTFWDFDITENGSFFEKVLYLHKGETLEYGVMPTRGTFVMQTLGELDTKISATLGNTVVENDDGGFGRNAFLKCTFGIYVIERVRIELFDKNQEGEVRFIATKNNSDTSWDSIKKPAEGETHISDYTTNAVAMLKYGGPTIHQIALSAGLGYTNLYVIDPRSTKGTTSNVNDPSVGGKYGYYHALEKPIERGVEYLILVGSVGGNGGNMDIYFDWNTLNIDNDQSDPKVYEDRSQIYLAGDESYNTILDMRYSDQYVFQTIGPLDTVMTIRDMDGGNEMVNDDGGYGRNALITKSFVGSQEKRLKLRLRIEFYDKSQSWGRIKFLITNATDTDWGSFVKPGVGVNALRGQSLTNGGTRMYRFGNVGISEVSLHLEGTYDFSKWEIYLIDPRSSEVFVYVTQEGDSYYGYGGGPYGGIHKTIDPGQEYLIIVSDENTESIVMGGNDQQYFDIVFY
ncbi:MAG: hypothetical protein FWD76_03885, partial [Firmicutes bacterium]|nr:hypothetical protein [Bacillota bacterium]